MLLTGGVRGGDWLRQWCCWVRRLSSWQHELFRQRQPPSRTVRLMLPVSVFVAVLSKQLLIILSEIACCLNCNAAAAGVITRMWTFIRFRTLSVSLSECLYRVAQNKIPQQTLCNFSAASCPILKKFLKLLNPDISPNRTVRKVPTAPLIIQPHYRVKHWPWKSQFSQEDFWLPVKFAKKVFLPMKTTFSWTLLFNIKMIAFGLLKKMWTKVTW